MIASTPDSPRKDDVEQKLHEALAELQTATESKNALNSSAENTETLIRSVMSVCALLIDACLRAHKEQSAAPSTAGNAAPASPDASPSIELFNQKPHWDGHRQTLKWMGFMIKQFKLPSKNQTRILAAFQEEDWPQSIADPLYGDPEIDPTRRLQDTIKGLNRNRNHDFVRFFGDGTGKGVGWELVHPERVSAPLSTKEDAIAQKRFRLLQALSSALGSFLRDETSDIHTLTELIHDAQESAIESIPQTPSWDPKNRILRVGNKVVKTFKKVPAPNQVAILSAFHEEGWPAKIYDPLPPGKLHATLHCLNERQENKLIHFGGDGNGEGVVWEFIPQKSMKSANDEPESHDTIPR